MAGKKKAATPGPITIRPKGPIVAGNMYTAFAEAAAGGSITLKLITSGTGRNYSTYTSDGQVRGTFMVERHGSFLLRFIRGNEVLAETSFTV